MAHATRSPASARSPRRLLALALAAALWPAGLLSAPAAPAPAEPPAAPAPDRAARLREIRAEMATLEEQLEDHRALGRNDSHPDVQKILGRMSLLKAEYDSLAAPGATVAPTAAARTSAPGNIFTPAIEFAQKRCVKIYGRGIALEHGWATGLIVSNAGHILTASGIYTSEERLRVVMPDGTLHMADVVRRSEPLQSVLLKISVETPDHFLLPDRPIVGKGDWVVAVGNPFNVATGAEPLSVNMGVVSLRTHIDVKKRMQDVPYDAQMLLIDAITANPGAPGGALMTIDGKLAGMVGKIIESKSSGTRLNYAVPADLLRAFLEDKAPTTQASGASQAATGKARTGIRLFTLSGKRAPAYIDAVVPGSPAEQAGLKKDDLILAVGEEFVRSVRDFEDLSAKFRPGQEVVLRLKRGNEIVQTRLTPAAEEK